MAATDVALCNLALGCIGHKKPISSLTDKTVEAQQCDIFYPHARDIVLGRHPWNFATRNELLALHSTLTDERWAYVYVAPVDLVFPRGIWGSLRNQTADSAIPFALEDKGTGATPIQAVLTDQKDARLVYTTNLLPIATWPVVVQDAVVWQLAAYLCGPLAVNPRLAMQVLQMTEVAFRRAAATQLNKEQKDLPQDSEFVRGR